MTRWDLSLFLLLLATPLSLAQEEAAPIVRASLEPETAVTVGQPVRLIVEVLVPTWFTGAPRYPQIDLADAVVIFQERGFNFTDRIEGATFAGQRRTYLVYPTRPGTLTISDEEVILSYAVNARSSPPTPYGIPEVRIEATVPAEAEGLDYFFAAADFRTDDRFDRSLEDLKVGDSLTRTISMSADDAFAMMLPSIGFEPVEGLSSYPGQPEVSDSGGERGETRVGRRVEAVTYVMQEEGEYRLPEIDIFWWDSRDERLRQETLPEITFTVAPNPSLAEEIPLPPEDVEESETKAQPSAMDWRDLLRRWAGPIAALVLFVWILARILRKFLPRYRSWREAKRRRVEFSEAAFFERFKKASLSGDLPATFRQLMFWLDRFQTEPEVATLVDFASSSRDPKLADQGRQLSEALFGRKGKAAESAWSGSQFFRNVARARKAGLTAPRRDRAIGKELPPLNPTLHGSLGEG